MNRNGKIARLPADLREQVNQRIENGETGRDIIAWLNSLPQVGPVLSRHFADPEINEGNLSEWKSGGYRDWETRQTTLAESRRLVEEGRELEASGDGALAEHLGAWIMGQYIATARAIQEKKENGDLEGAWKLLRELSHDMAVLRRGDHASAWIRLEQARLELERQRVEKQGETKNKNARTNPAKKEPADAEETKMAVCQILGINPRTHPMLKHKYASVGNENPPFPASPPGTATVP